MPDRRGRAWTRDTRDTPGSIRAQPSVSGCPRLTLRRPVIRAG